jgi:hypothetical protein
VKIFLGILSSSILSRWPSQLILCPFIYFTIFSPLLNSTSSRFVLKAVLVGLIQFRDMSKCADKSMRSLHSVSHRRKQKPQNAPQGRVMFLSTTARDQFRNTTVTSGLRLVTKRQTASIRRRAAASHREKATVYSFRAIFEASLPYLKPGDVRPQKWWMKNCQRLTKERALRYRGTIMEFSEDQWRK